MSSCKKQITKKYKTRKGPPYHAKDCKNLVKFGNDGISYISSSDKRGVYKWIKNNKTKKVKRMSGKSYEIINNGSTVFIAYVKPGSKIEVYTNLYREDRELEPDKKVLDVSYSKLFLGDNLLNDPYYGKKGKLIGNSLLIQTGKNKYVYVGSEIYSFETKEDIKEYYSPIGNSFVPYPYAVGETLTYFMLDKETIPNELLDLNKDAYGQYYGHTIKDKSIADNVDKAKKHFKVKIIKKNNYWNDLKARVKKEKLQS
jgi:hypothetical protein